MKKNKRASPFCRNIGIFLFDLQLVFPLSLIFKSDSKATETDWSQWLLVGQVGIEPTMFPMSRFYRPLQSPAMRTDPYGSASRDRTGNFQLERLAS